MKFVGLVFLVAVCSHAAPSDSCRTLQRHGKTDEARSCFTKLSHSSDPFTRAEGLFGLHEYEAANDAFREADHAQPGSAPVKTEWGLLYLERSQPGDAGTLFSEAIEADSKYAPAYLALARATAENYDKASVELAHRALQHDPKLFEAHELLAYLALEDSDGKLASEEAHGALALSPDALDAMAVLASMDWLDGKSESEWMPRILQINPKYGEAYSTGAHFLVINRRYEDGIRLYRKALELEPELWPARSQLGLNLMRVGQIAEARQELQRCYEAHFRDPETVNGLRLLDRVPEYQTFKTPSVELVLNKKEAALLQPYFQPELERAVATYERKYRLKLPGPVRLEVYPNHDDFAVRTLGLPGQGGLLGVTFGTVVVMDSPSARPPGEFSWAETMWHELSHVYVLTATNHFVPRWFTEGVAVHEERASSPAGSDRASHVIADAVKEKKLLPVLNLERGFVRPQYEGQVLVSYFEAGRMCDFIVEKWGDGAILGMMHSFAERKTTAEAIEANLHLSTGSFDGQFQAWLPAHMPKIVTEPVKWDTLKQHGGPELNYTYLEDSDAHRRLGNQLLSSGKVDDAVREFGAVVALHPDDVAAAHYDLARALDAANRRREAKDQVLVALEAAPDFKPAQQLFLKLSQ
jgi:cellulose synthase operon protein C